MILTNEQIEALAHKAERVVVTGDSTHKDIGIRVGNYSQATSITASMNAEQQERTVRRLHTDLILLNQKEERQIRKAQEERL